MKITDMKQYRKEIENEYINKGYSGRKLESALMNDSRYPQDRLMQVTGYDLENKKVLGLLGNKKCEVTIAQNSFTKGEELIAKRMAEGRMPEGSTWLGHNINENMAQAIPPKSQLILQESVIENKGEIISIVASRIIKVAPASENTFAGLFNLPAPKVENPKVTKVQHWQPNSTGILEMIDNVKKSNDSNFPTNQNKPKMK